MLLRNGPGNVCTADIFIDLVNARMLTGARDMECFCRDGSGLRDCLSADYAGIITQSSDLLGYIKRNTRVHSVCPPIFLFVPYALLSLLRYDLNFIFVQFFNFFLKIYFFKLISHLFIYFEFFYFSLGMVYLYSGFFFLPSLDLFIF